MDRRAQLIAIVGKDNSELYTPMIEQIILLEKKLEEYEKLPWCSVNGKNPKQQKTLPAFRIYKALFQQYTNAIKVIARASGTDVTDEESPLRTWIKGRINEKAEHEMDDG